MEITLYYLLWHEMLIKCGYVPKQSRIIRICSPVDKQRFNETKHETVYSTCSNGMRNSICIMNKMSQIDSSLKKGIWQEENTHDKLPLFGWQYTLTGKNTIWLAIHTDRQKTIIWLAIHTDRQNHYSASNTHRQTKSIISLAIHNDRHKTLFGWQYTLTDKSIIWLAIHTDRQKHHLNGNIHRQAKKDKHYLAGNTHRQAKSIIWLAIHTDRQKHYLAGNTH